MKDSAVLLIDCPDRKGLVARVAGLLYERGANILHADQHQDHDLGLFFMRVEWALADGSPSAPAFDLEGSQLNQIVRQKDPELLKAVEHLSKGEIAPGVAMLQQQGRVTEIADPRQRIDRKST